jgi:glycosyltransferase involved in cell wall biosynthesis
VWTYLRNLLRALALVDEEDTYIVAGPPEVVKSLVPLAHNFHPLPCRSLLLRRAASRMLWEQLTLPRIGRRLGADVIFCPGNVGLLLRGRGSPRVVITMHVSQPWVLPGSYPLRQAVYLRSLGRLTVRGADAIVTTTEVTRTELIDALAISPAKVARVADGVDTDLFKPQGDDAPALHFLDSRGVRPPYLLSVSMIFEWKNFRNLIAAYDLLRQKRPTREALVIAGRVGDRAVYAGLLRLIRQRKLTEHVHILTDVGDDLLPGLYRQSRLYVFPSYFEGFGLTALEAMACGVPVAASNASVMPEVNGDAAVYFDPFDIYDTAAMIGRALDDEDLRGTLRNRGLARAQEFSWHRTARGTLEVLRAAAASPAN